MNCFQLVAVDKHLVHHLFISRVGAGPNSAWRYQAG
jgi:hypothetical protein